MFLSNESYYAKLPGRMPVKKSFTFACGSEPQANVVTYSILVPVGQTRFRAGRAPRRPVGLDGIYNVDIGCAVENIHQVIY